LHAPVDVEPQTRQLLIARLAHPESQAVWQQVGSSAQTRVQQSSFSQAGVPCAT
jgi:hypothetical protein